jgi:tRNA dimethylallyltransferase
LFIDENKKERIFSLMKLYSKTEIFEVIAKFLKKNPLGMLEILGPTGSGKTGFAVEIAQALGNAEIICVDSRQVFLDIDISSEKVTMEEMGGILHWGLNLISPEGTFSVVDFQKYAFEKIKNIFDRDNIPILCGGTMLWLDAVSENYLFDEDPAKKSEKRGNPRYPVLKIGIHWDRAVLYERLDKRAGQQFDRGLVEETENLRKTYNFSKSALTSFGYKEVMRYLDKEITKEEAIVANQKRNRNYAKRQLTWWRGREDVLWMDGETL